MDISDIFYLFFICSGAGDREASEEVAGGCRSYQQLKIEGEGGFIPGGDLGGGRVAGECLWGGGGGQIFYFSFFRGRNSHQDMEGGSCSVQGHALAVLAPLEGLS